VCCSVCNVLQHVAICCRTFLKSQLSTTFVVQNKCELTVENLDQPFRTRAGIMQIEILKSQLATNLPTQNICGDDLCKFVPAVSRERAGIMRMLPFAGCKVTILLTKLAVYLCCSVLQCVAACCSVLQCGSVCCRGLRVTMLLTKLAAYLCCSVLKLVAACCSVLRVITVCCS